MPASDAPIPPLLTPRLWLRAPRDSDLESVYALHADPVANRFMPGGPLRHRDAAEAVLQQWLAHWRSQGFGHWAIAARERPELLLGFGGLTRDEAADPADGLELSFRFAPQSWGRGYATEVGQAALELAFGELGATAVQARVMPANMSSRKTLERLGLRLQGSMPEQPGQAPRLLYQIDAPGWAGGGLAPALPVLGGD